ncbi:MAG: D-alanyl-D-alanine carboxypeptidase [Candidatus Carbobacillus altaicus]|uniref:D-alanyl-D-alanine carboxypeptidase n=1 Tax=Candidatus Carbonibacillus altaicus TaxID=2163959 RepID=A0A2R6Y011_9BACL|nr:MAG: D-alanyl-D-alanine carboxypeptidase [Candidatus Carbobacillus altaicus]PTQ55962.1 MAG: D-alanyl-D-alanine carboxypeptidase [Candidatus Carbobacillus altaicus]
MKGHRGLFLVFLLLGVYLFYTVYAHFSEQTPLGTIRAHRAQMSGDAERTLPVPSENMPVQSEPAPVPSISARSAALIDVESGRILYGKDIDRELPIASLTKVMTAIVAIEEGDLNDVVTASPRAVGVDGSSIYLQQGETMRLNDLLYGLMLRSGNDAAVAIAEHIGGSEPGFVQLMNEKAAWLGLSHTHFVNPHGLDEEGHYSSARDLAVLSAYALKNPVFQEIVKTTKTTAPLPGAAWERLWINKNKLLRLYPGADGIKTGYTEQAKRCLASSATRNGIQLAAIVLNDGNDWGDSMALLDYGFTNFQWVRLADPLTPLIEQDGVKTYRLTVRRPFVYPLAEDELSAVTSLIVWSPKSAFSQNGANGEKVALGVATLEIKLGEKTIARLPLDGTVERSVSMIDDRRGKR